MKEPTIYQEAKAKTAPCKISHQAFHLYVGLVVARLQEAPGLFKCYGEIMTALMYYFEHGKRIQKSGYEVADAFLGEIYAEIDKSVRRSESARAAAAKRRQERQAAKEENRRLHTEKPAEKPAETPAAPKPKKEIRYSPGGYRIYDRDDPRYYDDFRARFGLPPLDHSGCVFDD